MIKIIFGCLLFALTGCNDNKKTKKIIDAAIQKDSADISLASNPKDIAGCYRMVIERDTAYMVLTVSGDAVSGQLAYDRFEKDRNEGDFTGIIYPNGEINVWYKFKSEGKINVRQSVFKIKRNALTEGYGEVIMKHDTVVFKFPRTLTFEDNHPFVKTICL